MMSKKIKLIFTSIAIVLAGVLTVLTSTGQILEKLDEINLSRNERINKQLFQIHFQEEPLHSKQLVIQNGLNQFSVSVDIYRNGDVFINTHKSSQWFPFEEPRHASFNLIAQAFAAENYQAIEGDYHQKNVKQKDKINRIRTFENGKQEILTINRKTGEILDQRIIEQNTADTAMPEAPIAVVETTAAVVPTFWEKFMAFFSHGGEKSEEAATIASPTPPPAPLPSKPTKSQIIHIDLEQVQHAE